MYRCFQQFAMYIWTKYMPYKILIFLSELKKYVDFNIEPLQIFGCDLWKMNNHFLFKKPKMMVFHKCLIDFF